MMCIVYIELSNAFKNILKTKINVFSSEHLRSVWLLRLIYRYREGEGDGGGSGEKRGRGKR